MDMSFIATQKRGGVDFLTERDAAIRTLVRKAIYPVCLANRVGIYSVYNAARLAFCYLPEAELRFLFLNLGVPEEFLDDCRG